MSNFETTPKSQVPPGSPHPGQQAKIDVQAAIARANTLRSQAFASALRYVWRMISSCFRRTARHSNPQSRKAGRGTRDPDPADGPAMVMATRDIRRFIESVAKRLHAWQRERGELRTLIRMDERQLKDFGLTRDDAESLWLGYRRASDDVSNAHRIVDPPRINEARRTACRATRGE